jgi:hypothetical protein
MPNKREALNQSAYTIFKQVIEVPLNKTNGVKK